MSNPSTAVAFAWPQVERAGQEEIQRVFHLILDAHYRRTYSFIYRMVRSEPDAADLTQETFIRVYKGLPRLREGAAATPDVVTI